MGLFIPSLVCTILLHPFGLVSLFAFKPSHVVPLPCVHLSKFIPGSHYLGEVEAQFLLLVVFYFASLTHFLVLDTGLSHCLSHLGGLTSILSPPFLAPFRDLVPLPLAAVWFYRSNSRRAAFIFLWWDYSFSQPLDSDLLWDLPGPMLQTPLLGLPSLSLAFHSALWSSWPAGSPVFGSYRSSC